MRKLPTVLLFCLCLAAVATMRAVSADNSMSGSGPTMMPKSHQYLIGTWDCTVKLAAMEGQPAMTDHGTLTIAMAPTMTLHSHVVAKDYMSDTYQGYNVKTKTHWLSTADTTGAVAYETSKDGMAFTGTTWDDGKIVPTKDTQTKMSDTKIRDITQIEQNGTWTQLADAVCIKS